MNCSAAAQHRIPNFLWAIAHSEAQQALLIRLLSWFGGRVWLPRSVDVLIQVGWWSFLISTTNHDHSFLLVIRYRSFVCDIPFVLSASISLSSPSFRWFRPWISSLVGRSHLSYHWITLQSWCGYLAPSAITPWWNSWVIYILCLCQMSAVYVHSLSSTAKTYNRWSISSIYVAILMLFPTVEDTVRSWQSETAINVLNLDRGCTSVQPDYLERNFSSCLLLSHSISKFPNSRWFLTNDAGIIPNVMQKPRPARSMSVSQSFRSRCWDRYESCDQC